MKCDLHVHTVHSGMCTVPVLSRVCRESYNDALEVYETSKRRGMDLVTITDHDSIGAVEELRRFPDFFLSEEVTCTTPSGTEMHAGVYGITERDHIELQRRRTDVESLLAYVSERGLFITVNHLYSGLTGKRTDDDFAMFASAFHGVETLNGQMLATANRMAAEFAARYRKPAIGGSDSHTMAGVGKTYTEVKGATTVQEYLSGLAAGHTLPGGESGNYMKLTSAVLAIGKYFVAEKPWMAPAVALFAAVPVATAVNYAKELSFAWHWGSKHRAANNLASPAMELIR